MERINIALIGYGGIGRVHANAYRSIQFHYALPANLINIVGVATTREETAKAAAAEIGCDFYTADYKDILARDDVHAVDICVPNNVHEEIVVASAKAGKHIYVEKPLAMSVAEGIRMAEAVESAGVKAQMTFNFRFNPAIERAKQLIDEGFLGRTFSFRGRYHRSSYISPDKPLSWRLRKDVTGGGALFDLGSHILDLLYFLLGDFESVQANLDTLIKERPVAKDADEKAPVDVDDIAFLHARLPDGTPGVVEISRMGTGATNDVVVEIFGDQGAIRFDLADPSALYIYDVRDTTEPQGGMRGFRRIETSGRYVGAKSPDWTMAPGFLRGHAECQYQFLKSIWDNTDPSPSLREGLHIQKIMEASVLSSEESRRVALSEI